MTLTQVSKMVDTVTLRLNEPDFKISNHKKFSPSSEGLFFPPYSRMGGKAYLDCYQNPTRKDLKNGNYKPQLTLRKTWTNGAPKIYLYMQFSAPKIIYNNNFDELTNDDFDYLADRLQSKLLTMGVLTTSKAIINAPVVKIHYGKNILLPPFIIPYMITKEVGKIDFDSRYDLAEKDYMNSGQSIRFHTKEFEFILYDKKKDLEKAKNGEKSIEYDSDVQLNLFEKFIPKKSFEILRIEARLNTTQRIKKELNLNQEDLTFKRLFKSDIALSILNKYWDIIIENYQLMNFDIDNKEKFLASFIINNKDTKITSALSAYAFIEFTKELGIRRFRKLLEHKYDKRSWYSLKSRINSYNLKKIPPRQIEYVSEYLQTYEPLYLKDFE